MRKLRNHQYYVTHMVSVVFIQSNLSQMYSQNYLEPGGVRMQNELQMICFTHLYFMQFIAFSKKVYQKSLATGYLWIYFDTV